jgi:hypothetical protein
MVAEQSSRRHRAIERCVACGTAIVSLGGGLWQAFEEGSAEFLCRGRPITCARCQGDPGSYCGGCASSGHLLGGHEPAPTAIGWPEPRVRKRLS